MDAENPRTRIRKQGASGITRREFARQAALVTATATAGLGPTTPLLGAASAAQESTSQLAKTSSLAPQSQAEIDGKIQAILGRYGNGLSGAQKADVQRLVREMQQPLEKLRSYSLANSDMPATVLKPNVEREKPRTAAPSPGPAKPKG